MIPNWKGQFSRFDVIPTPSGAIKRTRSILTVSLVVLTATAVQAGPIEHPGILHKDTLSGPLTGKRGVFGGTPSIQAPNIGKSKPDLCRTIRKWRAYHFSQLAITPLIQ
jgi:hypothetical protein